MGGHIVRGKRARATLPAIVILSVAILAPAAALAKGQPDGKGPPAQEAGNNLSVPTIIVGSDTFSLECGSLETPWPLKPPDGNPSTGYPIDSAAYYYVQGEVNWQAQCLAAAAATVRAEWGDNLGGDASLKVGSPVRVELGLFNNDSSLGEDATENDVYTLQGYDVVKLDPEALDRVSPYGTLASGSPDSGFADQPTDFSVTEFRVYDSTVTLVIARITVVEGAETEVPIVTEDPVGAEINATGKIVYGYNWRPEDAGDYRIRFTTSPAVEIVATDVGAYTTSTVSLDVTVAGGGGGGSGYHGH